MHTSVPPAVPRTAVANLLLSAVDSLTEVCRLTDGRTRQLCRHILGEARSAYEAEVSGLELPVCPHLLDRLNLAVDVAEIERQAAQLGGDPATADALERLQQALVDLSLRS